MAAHQRNSKIFLVTLRICVTARQVVARRLRSLGYVPGFGHRLYPQGDPRAQELISRVRPHGSQTDNALTERLMNAASRVTGERPNLDFVVGGGGTSTPAAFAGPDSPIRFGQNRGLIAHGIEQYADDQMIRPRAHYVGPVPRAITLSEPAAPRR